MRESPASWGRLPGPTQASVALRARSDPLPELAGKTMLPFGRGRSYGDSCLNSDGFVLETQRLDRFIAFDADAGTIVCEAGVSLRALIDLTLPKGWFLPVVPGTQFVSVGGAIANDVHGKNHHRAGTFGSHVIRFELLRSDDQRLLCSEQQNPEWFAATIGGLGLTGLVTWAELKLRRVRSALLEAEDLRFASLDEFLRLSAASDRDFEYTVAWFDCTAQRNGALRGVFSRARHVDDDDATLAQPRPAPLLSVPFAMPGWLLGRTSVRMFNTIYHAAKRPRGLKRMRLEAFLFPLDAVGDWNRLYGRMGFLQLQCVFPDAGSAAGVAELLATISRSGQGSFLTVLKRFGDQRSRGLLSFPMPGITVALDFQNRGATTRALLVECHSLVSAHGGRIYPAKDACMTAQVFAAGYPGWRGLLPHVDPCFSSGFWRRTAGAVAA